MRHLHPYALGIVAAIITATLLGATIGAVATRHVADQQIAAIHIKYAGAVPR